MDAHIAVYAGLKQWYIDSTARGVVVPSSKVIVRLVTSALKRLAWQVHVCHIGVDVTTFQPSELGLSERAAIISRYRLPRDAV